MGTCKNTTFLAASKHLPVCRGLNMFKVRNYSEILENGKAGEFPWMGDVCKGEIGPFQALAWQ